MSKSSCCGDFVVDEGDDPFGMTGGAYCDKCANNCQEIPDDIMPRKEILESIEFELNFLNVPPVSAHEKHLINLFQSVKHHMGER